MYNALESTQFFPIYFSLGHQNSFVEKAKFYFHFSDEERKKPSHGKWQPPRYLERMAK